MNRLKEQLTSLALALTIIVGCSAAYNEAKQECSPTNLSARASALAGACELRKAAECPKDKYPILEDCPYMQRCLNDLDALQASCEGK